MAAKDSQQIEKTLALCSQQQRSQEDIWYIRDRLHERCSFFCLWPSQLQQLICRLARPKHWVQNEVLMSQGSKPADLCFILQGQAAVAVRSAPGSSLLKDVAMLNSGDTFGELSLLGVQRSPAFIVVRSQQLLALAVDAQQLAQMMLKQQQMAPGRPLSTMPQAEQAEDKAKLEAIYKLIGATGSEPYSALSAEQQLQIKQAQVKQLQQAAAAECATVGTWLAPPHTQQSGAASGPITSSNSNVVQSMSAIVPKKQAAGHLSRGAVDQPLDTCSSSKKGQQGSQVLTAGTQAILSEMQQQQQKQCMAPPMQPCNSSSDDSEDEAAKQSSMMLRARHSAILHMAMVKAGRTVPDDQQSDGV